MPAVEGFKEAMSAAKERGELAAETPLSQVHDLRLKTAHRSGSGMTAIYHIYIRVHNSVDRMCGKQTEVVTCSLRCLELSIVD